MQIWCEIPREAGRDRVTSFITVEMQRSITVNPTAIKMDCDQNAACAFSHWGLTEIHDLNDIKGD